MDYIKVKDKNHLFRDSSSEGIVNTDVEGYNNYIDAYKRKLNESKKIESIENDMNKIKDDLNEIKLLLRNLTNGS